MRLRMVATDLDGTIVRDDQTVAPRTVEALRAAADAGVDVVFVTGRPPRWLHPVVEATGHAGTAVCANGAIVYDAATGRTLRSTVVGPDDVLEVARRLSEALPGALVALETLAGFRNEPGYRPRLDAHVDRLVGPLEDLLADDPGVVKILVRLEGGSSDAMLGVAREVLGGLAEATHSNARDGLLEVAAPGISKAATLAGLAAERRIEARDVVAFGDMPNDLAMLRWAGRGFAMADGHPEAIAAADAVAPPCEADGVAQVLEALLDGHVLPELSARG